MDSPTAYETVHRTVSYPSVRTGDGLSNPSALQNKKAHPMGGLSYLVGVSGFEPEASWTRTKRDTKLRHTPIDQTIIMRFVFFVKYRSSFSNLHMLREAPI